MIVITDQAPEVVTRRLLEHLAAHPAVPLLGEDAAGRSATERDARAGRAAGARPP